MNKFQGIPTIYALLITLILVYYTTINKISITQKDERNCPIASPGPGLQATRRQGEDDTLAWDTPVYNKEPITDIIREQVKRPISKWTHYLSLYHRHFAKFRGQEMSIMEIGVNDGGSVELWKKYFGAKAKVYGIDIAPHTKQYEEDQIKIFIGSQDNRDFLREIKKKIPKLDIFVDDGGHTMDQQRITFEEMFDHVKEDGGVYWAEDLHTSYWPEYGGGYKKNTTFVELTKNWIDRVNAYHSRDKLKPDNFTEHVSGITFYDSIVVIEKQKKRDVKTIRFN